MTTPTLALPAPTPARRPLIAFPLVLIALGIVFLLANAGYVGEGALRRLVDLWPVALVLIGLDILVRDGSSAVAIILEVAVIAASVAYAVAGPATGLVPLGTSTKSVGRLDETSLALTVDYGAGRLTMHSGTTELVSVSSSREDVRVQDVRHSGSAAFVTVSPTNDGFFFGTDRTRDVVIPSDILVTLTANVGAGNSASACGTSGSPARPSTAARPTSPSPCRSRPVTSRSPSRRARLRSRSMYHRVSSTAFARRVGSRASTAPTRRPGTRRPPTV